MDERDLHLTRRILIALVGALLVLACTRGAPSPPPAPATETTVSAPSTPETGSARVQPPPERDLLDLAQRFRGYVPGAGVSQAPRVPIVGERERFSVLRTGEPRLAPVAAVLRLATPHALFYFEDGTDVDPTDLDRAGRAFEELVYPRMTAAFGPPRAGTDGDERISILHLRSLDIGGYFTGSDQYPPEVSYRSNARNIIYVNSSVLRSGPATYNSIIAHELQHLLHWHHDHNEAAWVNEGLSELAAEWVTGRRSGLSAFLNDPDRQLNAWPATGGTSASYAAGFLFFRYLFQRLNTRTAEPLLLEQADGMEGVRHYLRRINAPFTFEDLFADWAVTNLVNAPEDERYGHRGIDARVGSTKKIAPGEAGEGTVQQFGTDYLELSEALPTLTFRFEGATTVPVIPTQAPQGHGFWWSNRGDGIDTTLTREVDLRGVNAATLRFWTWFDLEAGWDYGYVAASLNGGRSWQALSGKHTSERNPVQLAYGPGYTGRSGGNTPAWVEEEIDLTPYAGKQVLIRFEQVTDDSANGPGWAIDDIQIPEAGFRDDVESDVAGWEARGFQRISAPLPQRFIVQVIALGERLEVHRLSLDSANRGELALSALSSSVRRVIIAISGATEGTTEPATYRYSVRP